MLGLAGLLASAGSGFAGPVRQCCGERLRCPGLECVATVDQCHRDGGRQGGHVDRAQGSGAEFLLQAALGEDRQAETRFGHALLHGQAVGRQDLGRPEPVGGEQLLQRTGKDPEHARHA